MIRYSMNRPYLLLAALLPVCAMAQFTDDLEDGDFTNAPAWSGSTSLFTVVDQGGDQMLRSNSPGAANYHLSTPSTLASDARWEWFMDLRFSTSGANYVDMYLMADNADLTLAQNGWFVRVGGTADRVELFKRVAGVNTSVLVSADGIVNGSSSNPFRIRVERTTALAWTLFFDDGNTGTFASMGPLTDAAVGSSTHFGVRIEQSSAAGPVNNHYFDDFVVGNIPVDLTPPAIVSVTATSATNVDVVYSEPLSAAAIGNYDIIPFIGVSSATLDGSDPALVHVTPAIALTGNNTYSLLSNGAQDLGGNTAGNASTDFAWVVPAVAEHRDVVINEFMADPAPIEGLPDAEFVELFNTTTNKTFDLAGWKFTDGTSTATLPSYALGPGQYVIITSTTNSPLFASVGERIAVSSLPSLNNESDDLALTAPDNTLVDAVSYTQSWYRDSDKEDGGWTLEQIDPTSPCSASSNWRASNATAGGTPSAQNSVYAIDTTPPVLAEVLVNDATSLELVFSEAMDTGSLTGGTYAIDPAISVTGAVPSGADRVVLTLAQPLTVGVFYTVTVSGVTDCVGNVITASNSATFALPEPVLPGDLVINEVLYDPVGSGSDFVELYNRSAKTVSLGGLQLANETNGVIASYITITTEIVLLLPGEYILLTPNSADIISRYPQSRSERFLQTTLPSYNNDNGAVVLTDATNTVIDLFRYDDDLHFVLVGTTEGYSLERVSPDRPTDDPTNWHTASDIAGRATPGFVNSQYAEVPSATGEVTIDPAIFSPDNDGYQDLLTIAYRFDEPGFVGNMSVYDITGREVRKLMENLLLGTEGAISWDGLLDSGDKGRIGPYIILMEVYDLEGNVEKYKRTVTLAHRF